MGLGDHVQRLINLISETPMTLDAMGLIFEYEHAQTHCCSALCSRQYNQNNTLRRAVQFWNTILLYTFFTSMREEWGNAMKR